MIESLAFIFLVGLLLGSLCTKIKLPRIIGMLLTGIILGPYVLNLLSPQIIDISADLRKIALIIILLKAGLSLDLQDLKKVGRPAIMMSFIPATFEIIAYILFAPKLLGISVIEAGLMGTVLGAVSPAIVVPRMVAFMEEGYGVKKGIPQLILAGASCDDIFVIVLFSSFLGMAQGGHFQMTTLFNIPISIILGILLGIVVGYGLYFFFEKAYINHHKVRNSTKVIIILGFSFLLVSIESWLENTISISGLLAVVSMACVLKMKCSVQVSSRLSEKFGKLWLGAEVILFVLVGAAVDIRYTLMSGLSVVFMILLALIIRSLGVYLCTYKTAFNQKERLFCILAYLPKATVQAAIGSVPLAAGVPCGKLILSVAVMAIIITAPLGAIGIDNSYQRLLDKNLENVY